MSDAATALAASARNATMGRPVRTMDTVDFFLAIRRADLAAVHAALAADPALANARATSHRFPEGETEVWSPLHAAIEARSPEIARALVQAGADLEARTERASESRTPLHDSIEMGQPEITELLLAAGAYVDVASAAILGKLERVRELLDEDPALANDLSSGLSPLAWACYGDQCEVARELIERGARLDDCALACAASCGHVGVARVLLECGYDVDYRNGPAASTALHAAAAMRYSCDTAEVVTLLLEAGADVDARMADGRTPLSIALDGIERIEHPQAVPEECKQREAVAAILRAHGAVEP